MKALEEAAKKEGELTWYVAHYTSEGAEELGAAFTKIYGIKVNVVRTTAQVAYQRADAGHQEQPDDLRRLLLDRHRPLRAAQGRGPAGEVHAGGRAARSPRRSATSIPTAIFHTTSAGLVLLTYNTSKVKAEDAPKNWTDLLDPKWKGKVSTGHPGLLGLCRHLGADA